MKYAVLLFVLVAALGCGSSVDTSKSLLDARKGHETQLSARQRSGVAPDRPPSGVFQLTTYPAQQGELSCYITPDPGDGKKHPAIIWITGGECNTIGDVWSPQPSSNDQSAAAFRQAGIVMMFPSLRGGNRNPGHIEGFYGEVNDVLAAAAQLAYAPYVDPQRIYLGGHSTGGTLVMLCAAASDKFRAVFSFGPAHDVAAYGGQYTPIHIYNRTEVDLRSPIKWLHSIQSPVFVFEGTTEGNLKALQEMQGVNKNPLAQFFPIEGHNHFSVLDPINRVIASKILADTGEKTNITFTAAELTGR